MKLLAWERHALELRLPPIIHSLRHRQVRPHLGDARKIINLLHRPTFLEACAILHEHEMHDTADELLNLGAMAWSRVGPRERLRLIKALKEIGNARTTGSNLRDPRAGDTWLLPRAAKGRYRRRRVLSVALWPKSSPRRRHFSDELARSVRWEPALERSRLYNEHGRIHGTGSFVSMLHSWRTVFALGGRILEEGPAHAC